MVMKQSTIATIPVMSILEAGPKATSPLPNPGLGTWTLRLHDTDNNGRELIHVVFEVGSSLGSSERLHQSQACEIHILKRLKVSRFVSM